jgi:hypothetical protein
MIMNWKSEWQRLYVEALVETRHIGGACRRAIRSIVSCPGG